MAICSGFMASRFEPRESLDDFPTPPWAGRALVEHVLGAFVSEDKRFGLLSLQTLWEPAVNRGSLLRGLREYFGTCIGSDVHDYGIGAPVTDYLTAIGTSPDWIITNPPYILAHAFIDKALGDARRGCAFLVRTSFLEGENRYHSLFKRRPPAFVAQFSERVPIFKGRLDPEGSTMTAYCWIGWIGTRRKTEMMWIPPCRDRLERPGDYDMPEMLNAPR
jgi:hypothetical protein